MEPRPSVRSGQRERRQPKGHRSFVVAPCVVIQPVGPGRGLAQPDSGQLFQQLGVVQRRADHCAGRARARGHADQRRHPRATRTDRFRPGGRSLGLRAAS